MFVTICGRFCPEEGVVASYDSRIRAKYTAKWGVQIVGMLFQTYSDTDFFQSSFIIYYNYSAGAIPQGAFAKELNSCYLFSKKARISFSEACTEPCTKKGLPPPLPFNTAFISFVN